MSRKKKNTAETAAESKETVSTDTKETEFVPFEPIEGAKEPVEGEKFEGVPKPFLINDSILDKPLLFECQTLRANGDTCLQELENVKTNPNEYSYDAKNAVLALKNLCSFCKEENQKAQE